MKVNKAVAILTLCSLFFCACSQNTLDTNANGENTESIQEPKVTTENINNSETVEITEDTLASSPFKVQIDKPTLEMVKEKETTVIITADIENWDYTVSAANGTISDLSAMSFTYTVPKDEKIREDTITLTLSDYDNGKQYKYRIPFIFSKIDEKMILDN